MYIVFQKSVLQLEYRLLETFVINWHNCNLQCHKTNSLIIVTNSFHSPRLMFQNKKKVSESKQIDSVSKLCSYNFLKLLFFAKR